MDFEMEVDEIVDLSKDQSIDGILNFCTPCLKVKRRSSFFKPDEIVKEKKEVKSDNIKRDRYLETLEKEQGEWMNLVRDTNNKIRTFVLKEKVPVDSSILSKERIAYLDQAVDLPKWFQEMEECIQRNYAYIKYKEWLIMRLKYAQEQLENKLVDASIESLSFKREG